MINNKILAHGMTGLPGQTAPHVRDR